MRALHHGDSVIFPTPDGGYARGVINLIVSRTGEPFAIAGDLITGVSGSFSLALDPLVGARGLLIPLSGEIAYRLSEESGQVFLDVVDKNAVICHGIPQSINSSGSIVRTSAGNNPSVPLLQSRPGALGVLYIDLDGETVTDPFWNSGNTINATAPVFVASATIERLWKEVAEAFAPFNINVTTDENVYKNAPLGRRMRIIVTSNNWFGAGGVALLNSFQWAGTTPCWAFNGGDDLDSKYHLCAMTISHEFGHTFGLWHDGLLPNDPNSNNIGAYYQGHMTSVGGWGPIMGAPFTFSGGYSIPIRPIVQWSRGEYEGTNASSANLFTAGNNNQNDVAIIAGPLNGVGYVADDYADTPEAAAAIPQVPANSGTISLTNGLIHADSDVDVFRINSKQGTLEITATNSSFISTDLKGVPFSPALKIRMTLINSDLVTTNLVAEGAGLMTAAISTNLPAGTYYLRVEGVGTTTNIKTRDGFVGYGSIGQYGLSGKFQVLPRPPGDNFPDECIQINSSSPNFTTNTLLLGATAQTGEKSYLNGKPRNSIWFSWSAPGSGTMNLSTDGSSLDTTMAVYVAAEKKPITLGNLVLVTANDDVNFQTKTSMVKFDAVAGYTYYFVVDSKTTDLKGGSVKLNGSGSLFYAPPANDDFAKAQILPSQTKFTLANNSLMSATAQSSEPSLAGLVATRSVWFRWACPTNGKLALNTKGSACDTVLGVYTGTVVGTNWGALKLLAANDNISQSNTDSEVILPVSNNVIYFFKVDSRKSTSGNYSLEGSLTVSAALAAPNILSFALTNNRGIYQPLVEWAPVPGALGYEVNIFSGANRIYSYMATNGIITKWTNGPALTKAAYGVQMRAYSNNLFSVWSQMVTNTIK